jgi:hypothetical protein
VNLAEKDSAQIVPLTAIVNRNGMDAVFMANDSGIARLIPVKKGIVDGDKVEVLDPKLSGKVVTMGNHLLIDGAKISDGSQKEKGTGVTKQKSDSVSGEVKK